MWAVYLIEFVVVVVVSLLWSYILIKHDDEQKNKPTDAE